MAHDRRLGTATGLATRAHVSPRQSGKDLACMNSLYLSHPLSLEPQQQSHTLFLSNRSNKWSANMRIPGQCPRTMSAFASSFTTPGNLFTQASR